MSSRLTRLSPSFSIDFIIGFVKFLNIILVIYRRCTHVVCTTTGGRILGLGILVQMVWAYQFETTIIHSPPQSNILDTEVHTAGRVAEIVFERSLARVDQPKNIIDWLRVMSLKPEHKSLIRLV